MRGVCGMVAFTEGGHSINVGPVGCEGVTGIYTLAAPLPSMQLLVHVEPAEAQELPFNRFEEEMNQRGTLHKLVTSYYHAFFSEVVESVACNRLHSTRQRYCRRLLTLADRIGSETFQLTHDLMATMLGIQRPAVSSIALSLKEAGIIEYTRGKLEIIDRPAVEQGACECYSTARARIAHLLPRRAM
jgi:CRP-like cAMP-binding protein